MQSRWRRSVLVVALTVTSLFGIGQPAAFAGSGWAPTGQMAEARRSHVAAELPDGRVLVAGGVTSAGDVDGAELYDPVAGTWTPIARPLESRHYATATTLPDGRVLVTGGIVGSAATARSEIYDPASNTWTATGNLDQARSNHRAVLLNDGRVLVTGGQNGTAGVTGSELYDPATGAWTTTGSLSVARTNAQAALLADGRVLVAGGASNGPLTYHASAEVYTPATGTWTATAAMAAGRSQGAVVRLPDGRVLVAGGVNREGFNGSVELYDPATQSWTGAGTIGFATGNLAGALLGDGRVLLAGDVAATRLHDPLSSSSIAYPLAVNRSLASLTGLGSGRVLIAGGSGSSGITHRSAELFTPPTRREAVDGNLGSAVVGERIERDVAIENAGGAPLWVDGVRLAGADAADFSVVADGCSGATVAPAASCTMRVRFLPSAVGPRAAELRFDDNAEASPAVALAGTGTVRPVDPGPGPGTPTTPIVPGTPIVPTAPAVPAPGPPAVAPLPGPSGRVACPRYYVRLVGIEPTGTNRRPQVRLSGIAAAELTGRTVEIQRDGRRVGSARVRADRTVVATVPTLRNPRAAGRVRFRLVLDERIRSAALKATRGATIAARKQLTAGRIRIDGRIRGVRRASRLTVQGVPICGAGATVSGTARTDRHGRFRVVLAAPTDQATALVYRVRLARRTVTLPIVVPAAR